MQFEIFPDPIRILHVEDDYEDHLIMLDILKGIEDLSLDIHWKGGYEESVAALVSNNYDLCLLDYYLNEHDGLQLMQEALENGCQIPFVMLTGRSKREIDLNAMRSGVSFYLEKNNLDVDSLERGIRYSLEHARLLREVKELNETLEQRVEERTKLLQDAKERLEVEMEERLKVEQELRQLNAERTRLTLESMSRPSPSKITAHLLGIRSLQESAPDVFNRLVDRYSAILDMALEHRAYWMEENTLSEELRDLSDRMGEIKLGPRDVVQIYNTALKRKTMQVKTVERADAYVEEGRLTLLELMGYLITYYRNHFSSGF